MVKGREMNEIEGLIVFWAFVITLAGSLWFVTRD